jgi:programmed cell death protein 5
MTFPEPHDHPHDSAHPNDHSHNEQAAQKEQILKQILTPEARMRLNNIKMVKPELSDNVEQFLIGMATQGKMPGQITDDQLKEILLSTRQPKREFKMNRV